MSILAYRATGHQMASAARKVAKELDVPAQTVQRFIKEIGTDQFKSGAMPKTKGVRGINQHLKRAGFPKNITIKDYFRLELAPLADKVRISLKAANILTSLENRTGITPR